jgi:hypothetical protein
MGIAAAQIGFHHEIGDHLRVALRHPAATKARATKAPSCVGETRASSAVISLVLVL